MNNNVHYIGGCSSDSCHSVRSLLPGHALGILDGKEHEIVLDHIIDCLECESVLGELLEGTHLIESTIATEHSLNGSSNISSLPDDLELEVLAAIASARTLPSKPDNTADDQFVKRVAANIYEAVLRWRPTFSTRAYAACAMVLVVAVALVQQVRIVSLQDEVDAANSRSVPVALGGSSIAVDGSGANASDVFGTEGAVLRIDHATNQVVITGAPAPPEGKTWSIWQVDDQQRITKIGTISDSTGKHEFEFVDAKAEKIEQVLVTLSSDDTESTSSSTT